MKSVRRKKSYFSLAIIVLYSTLNKRESQEYNGRFLYNLSFDEEERKTSPPDIDCINGDRFEM